MRISILDSNTTRLDQICTTLRAIGHTCRSLTLSASADTLRSEDVDLLILNWQAHHSTDTIRSFRSLLSAGTPVLILAERADEDNLARLDITEHIDYIITPVRLGELATRVQVLLKRTYPERFAGEQFVFGPFTFEAATGRITAAGRSIDVTRKEFELALLLFRHLGRPLSRPTIQEAIWSNDPELTSRTMDTHVSRVRSKLGLRPENGFRLAPVYGYGYQLERLGE